MRELPGERSGVHVCRGGEEERSAKRIHRDPGAALWETGTGAAAGQSDGTHNLTVLENRSVLCLTSRIASSNDRLQLDRWSTNRARRLRFVFVSGIIARSSHPPLSICQGFLLPRSENRSPYDTIIDGIGPWWYRRHYIHIVTSFRPVTFPPRSNALEDVRAGSKPAFGGTGS